MIPVGLDAAYRRSFHGEAITQAGDPSSVVSAESRWLKQQLVAPKACTAANVREGRTGLGRIDLFKAGCRRCRGRSRKIRPWACGRVWPSLEFCNWSIRRLLPPLSDEEGVDAIA